MASKIIADHKPHAVCIPLPYQSHINSLMKLAKVLHHKGFYITFVNTEFNHKRLLKARGPDSLNGSRDFRFATIPDGLPPSDSNDSSQDVFAVLDAITNNKLLAPLNDLLSKINAAGSSNVPPVTCIVADGLMPFTVKAAEELGIPIALFFTLCASALMLSTQFGAVKEKGLLPVQDDSFFTDGYLDKPVDWIPGMKDIRLRDFPRICRTTDPNDCFIDSSTEAVENAHKASAILLHTFDALEEEVLNALHSTFRRVYSIGPLQLILNQIHDDNGLSSIGCNLWKEEPECLQWLDLQKPNSVIYVNFGSTTVMTKQQLIEFGMGLAKSRKTFLWIIRPDLVNGDSAILPLEFFEETQDRAFISSWCSQEKVLDHPSIGGFLVHCGWGSTIESISSGVPMVCWPAGGTDQHIICRCTCNEWGIGMEIDSQVNRHNVEKLVIELMDGEKGKKMKNKAMEWKKLAEEASAPSGSSSMNLDKLKEVLLS